jgi:hypothetical protein
VRLTLSRESVYRLIGGRTLTEQRVALGAGAMASCPLIHQGVVAVTTHSNCANSSASAGIFTPRRLISSRTSPSWNLSPLRFKCSTRRLGLPLEQVTFEYASNGRLQRGHSTRSKCCRLLQSRKREAENNDRAADGYLESQAANASVCHGYWTDARGCDTLFERALSRRAGTPVAALMIVVTAAVELRSAMCAACSRVSARPAVVARA